mgnify:CR=1 FL=1
MIDPQLQAEVLNQALPYIQSFRGQTFVVKYGGSAMRDPSLMRGVIRNVLLLQLVGIRPILVHGGGPEIDRWLEKLGIEKKTLQGLRVTDDQTMEVVEMALAGRANKALASEIGQAGGRAVGLSGRDANLLQAEAISPDLGRVAKVTHVDPSILKSTVDSIAIAVDASKLILLTDTDGVLGDKDRPETRISTLDCPEAKAMIQDGRADRGMIPKLEAAIQALEHGVDKVHLINGGAANALLIEVFTDAGIGTMMQLR